MGCALWTTGVGFPGLTERQAERAEQEGWDGLGLVDSQNLAADVYAELMGAARATSRLGLATAVTNPVTRHAAITATAAATVQAASGGRMVLGIGRGDSALAHLGLAPAPVAALTRYLAQLQGYLRGEEVPFEGATVDALQMAGRPQASRIRWLGDIPKVPVDVAATGPKVIAAGARLADRVTFAVGANAERIGWAIGVARASRPDVEVGAYVPVAVHADAAQARALVSGGAASFARFSVMHGSVNGPADQATRDVLHAVHDAYDMNSHFTHGSPQSTVLTAHVIDTFAVAGPTSFCVDRLQELIGLGLTKLVVMPPGMGADRDAARASRQLLVEEVLPALRG